MRRAAVPLAAVLSLLVVAFAPAQKPWEMKVNLPVPVPVELPAVPPTNPFATPLEAAPAVVASPMVEKLDSVFRSTAAVYVDTTGVVRRAVLLQVPLPGVSEELRQALLEASFTAGRALSGQSNAWLDVGIDLEGRVDRTRVLALRVVPPDPAVPPVPDGDPYPPVDPRDLQLPFTPLESLDQLPVPKAFRARLPGRTWRQEFRLLAEVSPQGRCTRVVFLSCPPGLRRYLLASLAGWTFRPAQAGGAPATAWAQVEGALGVEVGALRANALRVMRISTYPRR